MIGAILWREWREHRAKYGIYWLLLNFPVLFLALLLGVGATAKNPISDLSNATIMKYLPISLGESGLLASLFLIFTGCLAVATFSQEIENGTVFFVYEQALARGHYAVLKLLSGGLQIVVAACFAALLAPAAIFGMMLMGGKVTMAASGAAFGVVMAAAARSVGWCMLISLMAFTLSAFFSVLLPKWWMAGGCAVAAILWFINSKASDFFDFFPNAGETSCIVGNLSNDTSKPWLVVSGAPLNASEMARLHWLPLLAAALLVVVFSAATALIYRRRELK